MKMQTPPNIARLGLEKLDRRRIWLMLDEASEPATTQREILRLLSQEVCDMTEELLVEMEVNRERARVLMAEFSGLFERAAEVTSILLDFDEYFGGTKSNRCILAVLAKRLERALCYLSGVLSGANLSDRLSYLDWINLKSDADTVWKTCKSITSDANDIRVLKLVA